MRFSLPADWSHTGWILWWLLIVAFLLRIYVFLNLTLGAVVLSVSPRLSVYGWMSWCLVDSRLQTVSQESPEPSCLYLFLLRHWSICKYVWMLYLCRFKGHVTFSKLLPFCRRPQKRDEPLTELLDCKWKLFTDAQLLLPLESSHHEPSAKYLFIDSFLLFDRRRQDDTITTVSNLAEVENGPSSSQPLTFKDNSVCLCSHDQSHTSMNMSRFLKTRPYEAAVVVLWGRAELFDCSSGWRSTRSSGFTQETQRDSYQAELSCERSSGCHVP